MDTDAAENLLPESVDSTLEPLDARERSRSDIWRAVALFTIFAGTIGLALVPPTRLPVLVSVFFSPVEKESEEQETKSKSGNLSVKKGSFETFTLAKAPDGRHHFAGEAFRDHPAQVVQATPVPSPGAASSAGILPAPGEPAQGGSSLTANSTLDQDLSGAFVSRTSSSGPSTAVNISTDALGDRRPPWQSANSGLVGGEVAPWEKPATTTPPVRQMAAISPTLPGPIRTPPQEEMPSVEGIEHLEQLALQFRALGAVRYRLERWGANGQLFRFTCEMPVRGVPHMTRLWEAIAPSPEDAMRRVLAQISANSSDVLPNSSQNF
ncbi:MAG: hypothetical protein WHT09_12250 [Thermogutta sp.]